MTCRGTKGLRGEILPLCGLTLRASSDALLIKGSLHVHRRGSKSLTWGAGRLTWGLGPDIAFRERRKVTLDLQKDILSKP